ncbi:hypothetical protein [Geitlerinema sp. PCC 9228]|uniref:hypothetical protein n=1 Tax=Geitlerinema sp. PCC 9228 TaxID=111611 RepID=UPI0008F9A5C4
MGNDRHEDFYKAADIGIYSANQITPHSGCDRESEFINLFLEPSFFHKVAYETIDGEDVEIVPKLRFRDRLIEQIGRELKFELQTGGFESRMYADTIASTLAVHIIKRHATRKFEPKTYTDGLPSYKLKIAIAYIHDHLDRNISLSEIAQQVQIILIPLLHSSNNSQISIHFNDPFRRLFFFKGDFGYNLARCWSRIFH